MAQEIDFKVGQRVRTSDPEQHRGTVRYIGPVAGQEGPWIGIEWDDPARGKHSGETGGQQYFQCSVSGAGSFVRAHKLEPGLSFVAALKARYKPDGQQADRGEGYGDMYIMSVRNRRLPVELVGLERIAKKQGRLEDLQQVALVNGGLSSAGPPGEIKSTAPNIRELDLAGNLLSDWKVIWQILEELTGLEVLDLSGNILPSPDETSDLSEASPLSHQPALKPFTGLRALVLNDCRVQWSQIEALKDSLPALEELHLCNNGIHSLKVQGHPCKPLIEGFESLQVLDLESNSIRDWKEIMRLSHLHSLEHLNVGANRLTAVDYPYPSTPGTQPFSRLQALLLGKNYLANWNSIDTLDKFPSLQAVRLSENPITDSSQGGAARFILVARIGKLTVLNGSQVTPRERKDSEIRYLRHVAAQYAPGTREEEILKDHPRFPLLVSQHKLNADLIQGGATANKRMAEELLSVRLTCVAAGAGEKAPATKKVPGSITVSKLKLLCEKLFRVKASRQRLFVRTEDSPLPTAMDDDNVTLAELGLGSTPSILVDEVDPAELQKLKASSEADHERRLQEQLRQVDLFRQVQKAELEDGKRAFPAQS